MPAPTVGAKIFADLSYLDQRENDTRIAPSGTGVDLTRFYLIFNERFDDMWSANITTDASYSSGGGTVDVFIKKAYLQYSLPTSKAFFARVGSADLPWVPFVEDLYGYRYVERVVVDRLHFGTSADWVFTAAAGLMVPATPSRSSMAAATRTRRVPRAWMSRRAWLTASTA
jgi:hypothetical protein